MLGSWLSSATNAAVEDVAATGKRLAGVSVNLINVPAERFVTGISSPEFKSAGATSGIRYNQISRFASVINGLSFGVADGVGVGLAVGEGTGDVHALPSKFPGFVEFDPHGVAE